MKISVVIPLYNKAEYIKRAIESVLNQTEAVDEIIVVDDGSLDGGDKLVNTYSAQVILLKHTLNLGVSAARNSGITQAKNDFIAFLDADDYWHPNFIAEIKCLYEAFPNAKVFSTAYQFFDGHHFRDSRNSRLPKGSGVISDYFAACCHADLPITASSVCIAKSTLYDVGLFPVDIRLGEDQVVWGAIACQEQMVASAKHCVVYDLSASTIGQQRVTEFEPSPHIWVFKQLYDSGVVPEAMKRSLRYLLHLTVMSCVKSNLSVGNRRKAMSLLLHHEFLVWDRLRILALLVVFLPPQWVVKFYHYARNFR